MVGDSDRMQQACMNIIQNSITFTMCGQILVYFGYDISTSNLLVIVNDRGTGIKEEDQKDIFKL